MAAVRIVAGLTPPAPSLRREGENEPEMNMKITHNRLLEGTMQ